MTPRIESANGQRESRKEMTSMLRNGTRMALAVLLSAVGMGRAFPDAFAGLMPAQEEALKAIARGTAFTWPEMNDAQKRDLSKKAQEYLDIYQRYHLRNSLNADVWYKDYDRKEVYRLEGVGDSACWTGHYLAALSLRWHLEPSEKLRKGILSVLDAFDLLTKVSGPVGYIARYAGPASDQGYREYYKVYGRGEDPERPGLGKRAYKGVEPYQDLVWLGYSSRDTYDGAIFGFATTLAYVTDREILDRTRQLVERVGDRLISDGWDILDGKGNRTRGMGVFKMAWMRAMLSANPGKFGSLTEEYRRLCSELSQRQKVVADIRYKEYFANNLSFICVFATTILEKDPEIKKLLTDVLKRMQDETASHLNAHFAALYAAATGDKDNSKVRAAVQGLLIDFPAPPKFQREVDLSKDPNQESFDEDYTKYAQLPHERVTTDFMWQRSPCVSHGGSNLPYELPGIDVFLPYWMGRVAGVIPAP